MRKRLTTRLCLKAKKTIGWALSLAVKVKGDSLRDTWSSRPGRRYPRSLPKSRTRSEKSPRFGEEERGHGGSRGGVVLTTMRRLRDGVLPSPNRVPSSYTEGAVPAA